MSAVLTAASTLVCPHQFVFKVVPKQKLFAVDNEFVVVGGDLLNAPITTCTNNPKCTSITSITGGLSTTLFVGTEHVALEAAKGITNVGPWKVQLAGQRKLEAV